MTQRIPLLVHPCNMLNYKARSQSSVRNWRYTLLAKSEFTVTGAHHYNQSSPTRWIISHMLRYKYLAFGFMVLSISANTLYSLVSVFTGKAFNTVLLGDAGRNQLVSITLMITVVVLLCGGADLGARTLSQLLGKRVARDARDELYINLLGKSQTFHNRQRVGDIMARAANDMTQISDMIVPGFDIIFDSFTSLVVIILFIGLLNAQLLAAPLFFAVTFIIALRSYSRQLNPVSDQMRKQFGITNAILNEAVTGIEVVKATAQEEQEKRKFIDNASLYRDYFVKNGQIQGRYLPTLLLGIALAFAFLHGLYLLSHQQISLGTLVTYM